MSTQNPQAETGEPSQQSESASNGSGSRISMLERVASLIGVFLVTGIVLYLLIHAVTGDQSPPNIHIEQQSLVQVEGGYLVQIKVLNTGGNTAANLQVEGKLLQGEESIESSIATIDYVAADSHHGIGLFFTNDPTQYTLELRAMSYQEP